MVVAKVENLARKYANEYRKKYRDDKEIVLHDFNFERVENVFGRFKRNVKKRLLEDFYQEIWVACLDNTVVDIKKYLKYWSDNEWRWLKPRMYLLDSMREEAIERAEEDAEIPEVGDIIYDLLVQGLEFVKKHRYSRNEANIRLCVRILLQLRRCRITPYYVAIARLDGICPWCAGHDMDFGKNREFGLCHRCNFSFYTKEEDYN